MDNLPYAMILGRAATRRIAHSALPDAPVVPDRPRHEHAVAARPRARLARALRAAAALVAPDPAPVGRCGGTCLPAG